ncbi:LysE family translocator, partial [Rhizobium ruizarguesonis]
MIWVRRSIMDIVKLLAFAAVSFVGIATPGPTVMLALTNGSRHGLRRA